MPSSASASAPEPPAVAESSSRWRGCRLKADWGGLYHGGGLYRIGSRPPPVSLCSTAPASGGVWSSGARNEKGRSRWNGIGLRGADGNRNHDLFDANEALYQLSYSPLGVVLLRRTTQFTVVRPPPKCKTASQCTCVECVSDGEYQRRSIGACVSKCIPPPHSHYRNTICWLSSRRSFRQSGRYALMRR